MIAVTARPRREVEAELAEVRWVLHIWYKPALHGRLAYLRQHHANMRALEARLLAELAAVG